MKTKSKRSSKRNLISVDYPAYRAIDRFRGAIFGAALELIEDRAGATAEGREAIEEILKGVGVLERLSGRHTGRAGHTICKPETKGLPVYVELKLGSAGQMDYVTLEIWDRKVRF